MHRQQGREPLREPKVEFRDRLELNGNLRSNDFVLSEGPRSDDDPAIYHFAMAKDPLKVILDNLVFNTRQGIPNNINRLYRITLVFHDMSHKEIFEYCAEHQPLNGLTSILTGS